MEQLQLKTPEIKHHLDRVDVHPVLKRLDVARRRRARVVEEEEERQREAEAAPAPASAPERPVEAVVTEKEQDFADDENVRVAGTAFQGLLTALGGPATAGNAALTVSLARVMVESLTSLTELRGARGGRMSATAAFATEDIAQIRAMMAALEGQAAMAERAAPEACALQ